MSRTLSVVKELIGSTILIYASLIAALTVRFLWIDFQGIIQSQGSYWEFVAYSILALRNALVPSLLAGLAIFFLYYRRLGPTTLKAEFLRGSIALMAFFASMGILSLVLAPAYTFPRETWVVAWVFSVMCLSVTVLTRHLSPSVADRLLYSRSTRLLIDGGVIALALVFAYILRFDFAISDRYQQQLTILVPYVIILSVGVNYLWGVYAFIWRFTGLREALVIAQSVATTTLVLTVLRIVAFYEYPLLRIPFGILFTQVMLTYVGFLGVRVLRRVQHRHRLREGKKTSAATKKVLLIGAGQAGQLLLRELGHDPTFNVVGFLDDDPRKIKRVINGVRVMGGTEDLASVVREYDVDEVILCMPTASRSLLTRMVKRCEKIEVKTSSVSSMSEIVRGNVALSQLRPVRMEDLLGRASVEYDSGDRELIDTYRERAILVTGAAGSIGSELVRQLKAFSPAELVLLDKDENGLYEIGMEIREDYGNRIVEVVGDIRDPLRVRSVFEQWKPKVVFHATAYKHVPLMEDYPSEAILNNVVGSRNLIRLSSEFGVACFVLISTDKAVNPMSVMGASKRVAEAILQRESAKGGITRFCGVRFGNVLGSRASVVPVFQRQIARGQEVTVTHPEVRRYFMTIPEAVQLVIQAGSLGRKGELFLLDMGDPVKIVDLARDLIELSGLVLDQDIKIEFTGLRPGEKLCEELLIGSEDGIRSTSYPKIFMAKSSNTDWEELNEAVELLERAARDEDVQTIYKILRAMGIGYNKTLPERVAAVD